jgi:Dyp-type peroxidase family
MEFAVFLNELQANILKGHGRRSTRNLFLAVKSGKAAAARAGMKALAPLVTTAKQQLDETAAFKASGTPGGRVILALIAGAGYKAMGTTAAKIPTDAAFSAGMASRQAILADPLKKDWEPGFPIAAHAMILIADASEALCRAGEVDVLAKLGAGWAVTHVESGQAILDDAGNGLEHFGYVDGRSQPLMLTDDTGSEAMVNWNAAFGPDIVLVGDRAGTKGSDSMGSYFVFRKLEQDVAGFKAAEAALADAQQRAAATAGVALPDRELAGAMMVGRFEDGSPALLHAAPSGNRPENDFNYAGDPAGRRCPLHAHIRKTNPRNGSERGVIMARRGIPYGGGEGSGAPVGLLFMSYNKNIPAQFEFIQQSWANNIIFPAGGTGLDPIIGQAPGRRAPYADCPIAHGNPGSHTGDFQQYVTMRGGEYFFAPSISGLKNL